MPTKKLNLGLSEFIQSGILVTLLSIAYSLGQFLKETEMKFESHDRRIAKLEERL